MSSKIYAGASGQPAEPLIWPRVDGNAARDSGGGDRGDSEARQAEMQREAERRVQEARQAGFQDGLATAKTAAAAEIKALNERVGRSILELVELRPRLRRQAEADLVKLALAIARRILHRELAVDPEAMRGLIQAALEKLQSQEIYRVRIHPSQEALVRSMLEHSPQARSLQFQSDPALEHGAAVFETTRGNLDASVETQLREIEQGLTDRLDRT
jgi:flagellar assembly protein FliH